MNKKMKVPQSKKGEIKKQEHLAIIIKVMVNKG